MACKQIGRIFLATALGAVLPVCGLAIARQPNEQAGPAPVPQITSPALQEPGQGAVRSGAGITVDATIRQQVVDLYNSVYLPAISVSTG